jgi:hypothetical protein
MRHFDTAIVNVPLAKRGNIDAAMDAYKREVAKKERATRKAVMAQRDALVKQSLALLDQIPAEWYAAQAKKYNTTKKQIRVMLESQLRQHPQSCVKAFAKQVDSHCNT